MRWRGAGVVAVVAAVAVFGVAILPDRGEADATTPVQIAQAPVVR